MRIGLISDTHVPDAVEAIPPEVAQVFEGVDLILHAGDIYAASVLDDLEQIAPVIAARGDDDYALDDQRVADIQRLTLEGVDVYLIHSSQYWARDLIVHPGEHGLDAAPDVVVFGHTHRDHVQRVGRSLLVNPGSATLPQYQMRLGTVALLDIEGGQARARIVELGSVAE